MPAIFVAALVFAAVPIAVAVTDSADDNGLVTISGTVKSWDCCKDYDENETDECNETREYERAGAFMMETDNGSEIMVEIGPWWYWLWVDQNGGTTVKEIIDVGDEVNVTGELEEEDDMTVLEAWSVENVDTGDKVTIKEEACPPWAGGPKELGINPWPPSKDE